MEINIGRSGDINNIDGLELYFYNDENDMFFLIDPIDGTSSFINNSVEFCINIALIKPLPFVKEHIIIYFNFTRWLY